MKIVFFGKGERGNNCLLELLNHNCNISLVVYSENDVNNKLSLISLAEKNNISWINPPDPNDDKVEERLKLEKADFYILGGYDKILQSNILDIPKLATLNMHAGKLPEMRGSSPMNWALIKGHKLFTLSIIEVDSGVDTGSILIEETYPIETAFTINDMHRIANENFPKMLIRILNHFIEFKHKAKKQKVNEGAYFPLRSADDGFVLFDMLTAEQLYNTIRALTMPYPCAFTFYKGRKVKLISAKLHPYPFYGEPGKIYKISRKKGILVCAKDMGLWITKAIFEADGSDVLSEVIRYDSFSTVKQASLSFYNKHCLDK